LTINKESKSLGMPWEKKYGYAQAVKVGDTIYVSGQLLNADKQTVHGIQKKYAFKCPSKIQWDRATL
jgi:hypothetical protein